MASDPVHPLRIAKNGTASPSKMASGIPRPLSELSPTEKRRNSPSWTQSPNKMTLSDSSPFQSSPVENAASPRLFWQNRNLKNENSMFGGVRAGSPSPTRRSSIERLQKASRVKNSNILALEQKQEYDPTRLPHVERPLSKVQGNAYGGTGVPSPERRGLGHHRNESKTQLPLLSPTERDESEEPAPQAVPRTPSREQGSPMKSSLSTARFKGSYDADLRPFTSEDVGSIGRLPKSVTFDAAPPQVNEYEMATPDLSSVGTNSREGSYESETDDDAGPLYNPAEIEAHDDSFDASLEDIEKTPVVGPDDWRQDSPLASRGDANSNFESSPMPEVPPSQAAQARPQHQRTDSSTSSGDHRPLPPLPGGSPQRRGSRASPSLTATAERMLGSQRGLPSPPMASPSKEIPSFGTGKMTLEERLKLMMSSDDGKTAAELQRERRLRRGGTRDKVGSPTPEPENNDEALEAEEGDDTLGDLSALGDFQLPSKISRESIMRRVDSDQRPDRESDFHFSSPPPDSSPNRRLPDPDVPLPSTEDSVLEEDDDDAGSVIINRTPLDEKDGLDYYHSGDEQYSDEDNDSRYSDEENRQRRDTDEEVTTPRPMSPVEKNDAEDKKDGFPTLEMPPKLGDASAYLRRPFTPDQALSKPEYDGSGWGDPEDEFDEPGTPDSVIRHNLDDEDGYRESPAVPEQFATIKASGSKLKTRPSATPTDLMAMREARRQVSREIEVPPIPERHRNRISRDMEAEIANEERDEFLERHPSFKDRSLKLNLDLGLSLDQDFERVIEAQKRGYLMRQNTKVITATDKDGDDSWKTRSAGNSPVKKERPQSWTVEPWNGKVRPRSVRKRQGPPGPAPPLPGQQSNATALNPLVEEEIQAEMAPPESGERGRLFIKVMGVKDLDLPLPKNERTWFSLTLDNGVHCVTTAWLELARNAPIGQEFELVVPNDLEFQLTLNVKLDKPAPIPIASSPTKAVKQKTSTFSRVFASPKKRKELELRQREEEERQAQQQREALQRQMNLAPTGWDLLSPLAAEDGSFARAYVCLKEHETRCFGRPYMVEMACFNEWATEEAGFASSVMSKRGNTSVVRRAPYKIGKLELQMLFVPRPKGVTDDDMPKSMNSCIRELKAAEERMSRNWEGHLSQQGGDCPYWRRRYFKLVGTKLTAYHEATRQPRATINLSNAKRLIDDRRALTEKETTGKGGHRRRSGFAEEEEGYMFVEEGFRIRFNNGELIDFYADTAEDKEGWMKVLSDVIGRGDSGLDDDSMAASRSRSKWCELVLEREEALRRRAEGRRVHSRTKSMYV